MRFHNLVTSCLALLMVPSCDAFLSPKSTTSSFITKPISQQSPMSFFKTPTTTSRNMIMDPSQITDTTNLVLQQSSSSLQNTILSSTDTLLSFSDQGQNLAGIFFQASLLPYLIFLYFLSFRGNRIPELGNFGFQFLLLFVISTIPSGIISKLTYGCSLADVDWLHGGAEALLTITNVLIVLGFRNGMTKSVQEMGATWKPKLVGFAAAASFAAACALGPSLGFQAHSPFLFGIGNFPDAVTASLPWVVHSEPANALSIPTWAIHFSSVFEFLFAMDIIWNYAQNTGNEKWKGLTWGMLPLHASGIAACTYHFFYNPSSLQFLVSTQAGLTLLGNITCAIAAYRIAISNGWTLSELNPLPKSSTSPQGIIVDNIASTPIVLTEQKESDVSLVAKLGLLTIVTSYLVKYGELGLDLPFTPNGIAATAIVAGIPAITAYNFYNKSQQEGADEEGSSFSLNQLFGKKDGEEGDGPSLSMADVKKYGVAGTLAYVLTELAFWAVAFPVASTALYQSTGHWPDVINDGSDRATVVGFIFAGANIARLLVPLRLGAALALAPWVDENILNRGGAESES